MRLCTILTSIAILLVAPAAPVEATEVSDLLSDPEAWAGKVVEVSGEIIGDYGRHSGSFWLQLNDDAYAMEPLLETGRLAGSNIGLTLRVPPELFEDIAVTEQPGGYRWRGPILRVTGEFLYHDPDRSGETYIAVAALELVESGRHLPSEATGPWGAVGVILAAGAAFVLARHGQLRRREWRLEE